MKKTILLGLCALFALMGHAQLKIQKEKLIKRNGILYLRENNQEFKVDTVIVTVKLKNNQALDTKEGTIVRKNKLGFIDLRVPDGKSVEKYAETLEESGLFEVVELNSCGEYQGVIVGDVRTNEQWYLDSLNIRKAWSYTMGNPNVIVAVLDQGMDITHVDLGLGYDPYKNIDDTMFWDYITDTNNTNVGSIHGTAVSGIICAKTNNGIGIAGIAGGNGQQGITLVHFRIGEEAPLTNIFDDAIIDAVDLGAKVINVCAEVYQNSAIQSAIEYAYEHGVTIVCGAGNNGSSFISYPASNVRTIAVGALNQNMMRMNSSQYGQGLDFVVPGISILTTVPQNGYGSFSSTSSAAPQLTGIIALMLSANPSLSPTTIHNILKNTAKKLSGYTFNSNGWNNEVGYGIPDAANAVESIYPMYIAGSSLICDTSYFYVSNLPLGFSVEWEIDNDYYSDSGTLFQTDYPENNECMIVRSSTIQLSGTLTARIYDETNTLIRTLTRNVATRTIARFPLTYEYGGNPVLMSWSVAENDPAKVPVGAVVKMGSSRFQNMNITATGAYSAFHHEGDSVWFTSASGNTYLRCRSENSCDQFRLVFYTNKRPPIIINPDLPPIIIDPILSVGDGRLTVTLAQMSEDVSGYEIAESVPVSSDASWQMAVYRYRDGKRLCNQTAQGGSHNVDIYGWEQGLYIVTIKVGEQIFTSKIVL